MEENKVLGPLTQWEECDGYVLLYCSLKMSNTDLFTQQIQENCIERWKQTTSFGFESGRNCCWITNSYSERCKPIFIFAFYSTFSILWFIVIFLFVFNYRLVTHKWLLALTLCYPFSEEKKNSTMSRANLNCYDKTN